MAIPSIAPYAIPEPTQERRVSWGIDPESSAVLVHDMQNYFIRAFDEGAEPISTAIESMASVVEAARANNIPVFYSVQPGDQHPYRRGLLREFWGNGMSSGVDTEVIERLRPREEDIVITKWRYSAFARTDLLHLMSEAGLDQLVITGVYAHMGCQATAVDAFMNDIKPFVVSDALADFSREEHATTIDFVNKRCGVSVTADEVVSAFGRQGMPSEFSPSNPASAASYSGRG